jgi:hypothetical protein
MARPAEGDCGRCKRQEEEREEGIMFGCMYVRVRDQAGGVGSSVSGPVGP